MELVTVNHFCDGRRMRKHQHINTLPDKTTTHSQTNTEKNAIQKHMHGPNSDILYMSSHTHKHMHAHTHTYINTPVNREGIEVVNESY